MSSNNTAVGPTHYSDPRGDRLRYFYTREGEAGTFAEDETLPSLPLPRLSHTLERYLDSIRPFASDKDFSWTKEVCAEFERGDGKLLHELLENRARLQRNWMEQWWLQAAYLTNRQPLLPYCSMTGTFAMPESICHIGPDRGIKNGAYLAAQYMQFWQLLRDERLRTDASRSGQRFSSDQYRRLFSTCRIPKKGCDELKTYWKPESEGDCPRHVIILCRGHIFTLVPFDYTGAMFGQEEWEIKLRTVWDWCGRLSYGDGVSVLTCQDRDHWAQHREWLLSVSPRNTANLRLVETAIMVIVLDEDSPRTEAEAMQKGIAGDMRNRWADKSITIVAYRNGRVSSNADHTPADGIVSATLAFFAYLGILADAANADSKPLAGKSYSAHRNLPDVNILEFNLDSILHAAIQSAITKTFKHGSDVLIQRLHFPHFGKAFLRRCRFHPDAFVQMALQLAYMRLHKKPAPTYETATTREFYHGRTETVRSCTNEVVQWCLAMDDPKVQIAQKRALLLQAVTKHLNLMEEAKQNQGCDRHLLGLQLMATEKGRSMPEIFTDPSYTKSGGNGSFVLSTSLTGYTPCSGGVAPMCKDGYGVFYNIEDHRITFCVFVYRSSTETSAQRYLRTLERAMIAIQKLIIVSSNPL